MIKNDYLFEMFKLIIIFICISTHSNIVYPVNASDCLVNMRSYHRQPVILSPSTYEFLYPLAHETQLSVRHNNTILISCPGGKLTFGSGPVQLATCIGGSTFRVSNEAMELPQNICTVMAQHVLHYTGFSCGRNGREIEVAFNIDNGRYVRLLQICFDPMMQSPLYVNYKLIKSILKREYLEGRQYFRQAGLYNFTDNIKMRFLYGEKNQRSTINKLVGLPEYSTKYVNGIDKRYLAKGHLAGKGDFLYRSQQLATYNYVNSAPQWTIYNSNNWEHVESVIRSYTITNQCTLDIYSGIYGISTLPHEKTGAPIELYLYNDELTGNKAIPIPEVFWKIVYNPKTKQGVAFVVHNNPYDKQKYKRYICNDVSDQIKWFARKREMLQLGQYYACTVQSLRAVIGYIPKLNVRSLMN